MTPSVGGNRVFDGGADMGLDQFFSITFDPSLETVTVEGINYTRLKFQLTPANAIGDVPTITWSSSNPAIATVDSNGLVTSVATGAVTISANTFSFTAYLPLAASYELVSPDLTISSQNSVLLLATATVTYNVSGVNYSRVDPDIYNDQYQLAISNMSGIPVWSSSDTSVATVSASGLVTGSANGVTAISVTNSISTVTRMLSFSRTNNGTPTIVSFDSGTLRKAIEDFFVSRLGGSPNPVTAKPIFTTQVHTGSISYVRNASCWMHSFPALTCCSPWTSTGGNTRAGTLITPRHLLFANHYQINVGATVRFVTMDGTVVDRTLAGKVQVLGGIYGLDVDCMLGVLSADVPNTISFAKVIPPTWANKLPIPQGTPMLRLDQEEKALVGKVTNFTNSFSNSDTYSAYSEDLIGGDSGNPAFLVVGSDLAILTTWFTGGGGAGPDITSMQTLIDSTISSLDTSLGYNTGYSCTTVDLSTYTTF